MNYTLGKIKVNIHNSYLRKYCIWPNETRPQYTSLIGQYVKFMRYTLDTNSFTNILSRASKVGSPTNYTLGKIKVNIHNSYLRKYCIWPNETRPQYTSLIGQYVKFMKYTLDINSYKHVIYCFSKWGYWNYKLALTMLTSSLLSHLWELDYTGTISSSFRVNENFNISII